MLATRQVSTGGGYGAQIDTPLHSRLKSTKAVSIAVTYLAAGKRKVQWDRSFDPAQYSGKSLLIQERD